MAETTESLGSAPCIPSRRLLDRVWRFVVAQDGLDCDCDCDGHDEDAACTDACTQCDWCLATELVVRWNQESEPKVDEPSRTHGSGEAT